MPMIGLRRSSSVKPTALNMERAPARLGPSVMCRLSLPATVFAHRFLKSVNVVRI